jgi:hypothetical protein
VSTIITRSVIDLAQELRIKLVAEGIENWDQLSYLKNLNCYSGQGFIYNKPMPINEFEQLLAKEKCMPTEVLIEKKEGRDKRKYVRIKLPRTLEAEMIVVETPGQKFKVARTTVEIKNISSEGLCFAAGIRLPVNKDLILRFEIIDRENQLMTICGFPVWAQELDEDQYEYGVEFENKAEDRMELTAALYTMCKEMYVYN